MSDGLVERTVVGSAVEVRRQAAVLRASGRLVAVDGPRLLPDGRVSVTVTLLRRSARHGRRPAAVAGVVVAVLAGIATAGYVTYLLTADLLTSALKVAAGVFVAAVIWLAALGRVGVCCPGLHCPGCRH